MKLEIAGPNLDPRLGAKATFHVHAEGCQDLKVKRLYEGARREGLMPCEATSRREVVDWLYSPGEFEREPGDEQTYLAEFHFAPCCAELPLDGKPATIRGAGQNQTTRRKQMPTKTKSSKASTSTSTKAKASASTRKRGGQPKSASGTFRVTELKFDQALVKQVLARRKKDQSLAVIGEELKVGLGKAAMAELVGTTPKASYASPADLAKKVVAERKAGKSWGYLAARYGVTEGTCRMAFTAGAKKPFNSLDYRKRGGRAS